MNTDAVTKAYVDTQVSAGVTASAISAFIRVGTVKVGNIGNYNIGSAVVTGTLLTGAKADY